MQTPSSLSFFFGPPWTGLTHSFFYLAPFYSFKRFLPLHHSGRHLVECNRMMCDTNWCTYCDVAISPYSDALYCSQDCLQRDAIHHHVFQPNDYQDAVMARYHENRSPPVIVRAARTRAPRSMSSKEDLGSSCSASTFSSSATNNSTPQ